MMNIDVTARSAIFGGGLNYVGEFLSEAMPAMGAAIESIRVDFLVRSYPQAPEWTLEEEIEHFPEELVDPSTVVIEGASLEGLEDILDEDFIGPEDRPFTRQHEKERTKGGALTFRRLARRVDVRIVSELSEFDVFGQEPNTPEVFARGARELVDALEPLPKRIKDTDDFDAERLLERLRLRLNCLPRTSEELAEVTDRLEALWQERWNAMSPWEQLDIDWSLYAPGARELLDDPFFWDEADDEAPHGNDTGADLMVDYLEKRPKDAINFMNQSVRSWGLGSMTELDQEDPWHHDIVVVATAFAELKVTGRVSGDLRNLALNALARRREIDPSDACALMRAKLTSLQTS